MNRFYRITQQLRLANGSHQPGSGKGCVMNAISYINGDAEITDFPACSARPLASFVQWCNDLLARPDGYLSLRDSVLAFELAWQTVGTAEVPDTVIHAWVAELLTNPTWGVVGYAQNGAAKAIFDIAELHRRAACDDMAPIAAWGVADRVARVAVRATIPALDPAGIYAVRAAYQSTAPIDSEHWTTLDALTGYALRAHALATGETGSGRALVLARDAIRSWRHLAALDNCGDVNAASVEKPWNASVCRLKTGRPTPSRMSSACRDRALSSVNLMRCGHGVPVTRCSAAPETRSETTIVVDDDASQPSPIDTSSSVLESGTGRMPAS
jgi:hypothetical protein